MIETVAAFCLDQRVWLLRRRELVSMGMVFVQSFIRKKDDGFQRLYSLLNTWNVFKVLQVTLIAFDARSLFTLL